MRHLWASVTKMAKKWMRKSGRLLSQSDFTYLGYYNWAPDGLNSGYAQGLTHRYVGGHLQFLTLNLGSGNNIAVYESDANGVSYGGTMTGYETRWLYPYDATGTTGTQYTGNHNGLWWDEANQKLWTTRAVDYDSSAQQVQLYTRTLNSNGTVSDVHGPVGLENVGSKRAKNGVCPIPSTDQSLYGFGPYMVGFGGYASQFAQGPNKATLGASFFAIPDISGYSASTEIPTSSYKTLADHNSGSVSNDWYDPQDANGSAPTTFDRGRRMTGASTSYLDTVGGPSGINAEGVQDQTIIVNTSGTAVTRVSGGGSGGFRAAGGSSTWWAGYTTTISGVSTNIPAFNVVINGVSYTVASVTDADNMTLTTSAGSQSSVTLVGPSTRPTHVPADTARWQDAAPDGYARWTWTDDYFGTVVYLRGASKYGVVGVATLTDGFVWYANATFSMDGRRAEFHVYDPSVLNQCASGTIDPWDVQPTNLWEVDFEGDHGQFGSVGLTGGEVGAIGGATFDSTTNILYLMGATAHSNSSNRIWAFQVNL